MMASIFTSTLGSRIPSSNKGSISKTREPPFRVLRFVRAFFVLVLVLSFAVLVLDRTRH